MSSRGQYELTHGEVITTIPAVNFDEEAKPTAGTRAKPTAGKTRAKPTAGKANQRTANRDKAKYEEKHSTKESCSQPVPDVQQGQYELKLGEVITTIPAIYFNEETVEYKNANCSDSSEAATQKVQKIVMDSLSLKQMYDGSQPSS